MRTSPKAVFSLVGVLLLAACTDNSVGVNADASGTYALNSVSGNTVPFIIPISPTETQTVQSGSLVINTDGTFSDTFDIDDTNAGQTTTQSIVCTGTFTQRGGTFDFNETATTDGLCGGLFRGTWNGSNTFSVAFSQGFVALYSR
jgi:hypothetical protein